MTHLRPALLLTLFFVAVAGIVFPVAVWLVARLAFPSEAAGSFARDTQGHVVGSTLIGQSFTKPRYFHTRPSAAGSGYDAASSGGTNLGPLSAKLIHGVEDDPKTPVDETYLGFVDLAAAYRRDNGLSVATLVPADAATRSASGLDPDISPANAQLQIARVAHARGLSAERVERVVAEHTCPRWLGLIGEPRVNVLQLNLALDAIK